MGNCAGTTVAEYRQGAQLGRSLHRRHYVHDRLFAVFEQHQRVIGRK